MEIKFYTFRALIHFQQQKMKEIFHELEKTEFFHDEQIRKIESDKQIYLNMIESRETKIENLLEEKDEISDKLNLIENKFIDKTNEFKKLQNLHLELENSVKLLTNENQLLLNEKLEYEKNLLKSTEENLLLNEVQIDLQLRYDQLVLDLDKMVEQGYYIPDSNNTAVQDTAGNTAGGMGKNRGGAGAASLNDQKRRSKAGVRLSDVHKAMTTT